jgi:hypothetical protein
MVLEVGGWRLEMGGWRLEMGGWRLEAGGWMLDAGMDTGLSLWLWLKDELQRVHQEAACNWMP